MEYIYLGSGFASNIMKFLNNKNTSIRTVLILLFVVQIILAVGITEWLSFRNGQIAVNDVAEQLRSELTTHIKDNLKHYLRAPHLVNSVNREAMISGELGTNNIKSLEYQFWRQSQLFDSVSYICFGNKEGNFIGVERRLENELHVEVKDNTTKNYLNTYLIDNYGVRTKLLFQSNDFVPGKMPWYKAAEDAGKPIWSSVNPFFTKYNLRLGITAVYPIFDGSSGALSGVLGTSLILEDINSFLKSLIVGSTGKTFIMERSGFLVASSTYERLYYDNNNKIERVKATDISEPMIQGAAKRIAKRFPNLNSIQTSYKMRFNIDGKEQLLQVTPITDAYGLDWILAVVVPEADFMEHININTQKTILLILAALLISTFIGIIITSRITKPLLDLSVDMAQIANFKLDPEKIKYSDFKEIQAIQTSMEHMYKDLKEYTYILNSINDLAEKAVVLKNTNELMELTLKTAIDLVEGKKGFIVEHLPDEQVFQVILSLETPDIIKRVEIVETEILKEVYDKRETISLEKKGRLFGEDFGSALISPLVIDNELKGVIFILNKKDEAELKLFKKQDITTMQTIGKLISSIWQNIFLFEMATVDTLSKLYVRRYMEKSLEEELKRSLRYKNELSLMMLDIDNFKMCNDTYGHLIGDKVIRKVASKVKECIRETDFAARFGGEEIVIFMPQTSLEGAYKLAERIRKSISEMEIFAYNMKPLRITVSIGVSCVPEHGVTSEEIIMRADEALYKSKREGKNMVTIASVQTDFQKSDG